MAYNFLNLPTKVDFGSGDSIVWVYTVSGAKLRKTVYDNGMVQTTIDYVNGYQYKNGSLDFFAMEAGRVKKTISGALRYEYNLTDHLGNTRVSFADTLGSGTAVILQEDHYYAFGLRIEGLSSTSQDNKFTYNGKELEDEHGLNWYHYGARYYDPQVGRWHTVDPGDEYNSPYIYVNNCPIMAVDPDGSDTWFVHGTNSSFEKAWTPTGVEAWTSVLGETVDQGRRFDWSGGNFSSERSIGAKDLVSQIVLFKQSNPDAPINLVAHSHGGNVAIEAANILFKDHGVQVDNLILIGTPARQDYALTDGAAKGFLNIYNTKDVVQVMGGDQKIVPFVGETGPAGRMQLNAININMTHMLDESIGPISAHSEISNSPDMINKIGEYDASYDILK